MLSGSGAWKTYNENMTTITFLWCVGRFAELPVIEQWAILKDVLHFLTKQCLKAETFELRFDVGTEPDLAYQGNPLACAV